MMTDALQIELQFQIKSQNAGYFVSRGRGVHPDRLLESYELIVVHQGEIHIREAETDFCIHAGESLILEPGLRHKGTRIFSPDLRFYWIHFEVDEARKSELGVPKTCTLVRPHRMEELFRRFLDDQEAGELHPSQASLFVMQMLLQIATQRDSQPPLRISSLANRVEQYITTNYHQPICTTTIARMFNYNADYLGRVYRQAFGQTVTDAIHLRRSRQARSLLLGSDANISEIAVECGYDDVGYFRRIFRRFEDMSPSAYRKLHSRVHVNTH
jgi:AraC-like DNA-binding protein